MLRPWGEPDDAVALAQAWSDPAIQAWAQVPEPRDEGAARRWIAGEAERRRRFLALDLVVHRPAHPTEVIGEVGLARFRPSAVRPGESGRIAHADVGYWVHPDRRGEGIARHSVALVCRWSLDTLGLDTIEAEIDPANTASIKVAEAVGFRRDDRTRWALSSLESEPFDTAERPGR